MSKCQISWVCVSLNIIPLFENFVFIIFLFPLYKKLQTQLDRTMMSNIEVSQSSAIKRCPKHTHLHGNICANLFLNLFLGLFPASWGYFKPWGYCCKENNKENMRAKVIVLLSECISIHVINSGYSSLLCQIKISFKLKSVLVFNRTNVLQPNKSRLV